MWLSLLRLVLAPLLVGGATVLTRRFGPVLGGRIVGLPLTAGPLLALLAVADGDRFAGRAATFDQAGDVAASAWCVAYAVALRRVGPVRAALAASATFAAVATAMGHLDLPVGLASAAAALALVAALRWWPAVPARLAVPVSGDRRRDDLALRMAVAAAFTFALTSSASLVGAGVAGLLGALPVVTIILTVATHARRGPVAAGELLQGVMSGSFSVIAFLAVVAVAVPRFGAPLGFAAALVSALAAQAIRIGAGPVVAPAPSGDDTGELIVGAR